METRSFDLFEKLNLKEIYKRINRPIVVADQIRTPENMGSILRLAGNIGAQKVLFISDIAAAFKNYKINKTASGAETKVDWQIISQEQITNLVPDDYRLIALETTSDATNLFDFHFAEKTAFIIGNEVSGISEELLRMVHSKLFIPIPGPISSLNVSHALSIALFEWLRQMS